MRWILAFLLLLTVPVASRAMAQPAVVERARIALADKGAELKPHGILLASYADSVHEFDIVLAAKCLEVSGISAFRTNDLDSAMARWQRGVDWAAAAGETRSESSLLNALAIGYTAQGDVEAALPVYERTLEIRESLADTMGLVRTWGNLATAYSNMGRTAESLAASVELEKWLVLVDSPRTQIANAIRRSQILTNQRRFDEALLEGRKAVTLAEHFGDQNVKGMAEMALGNALLDMNDLEKSLPTLEKSLLLLRSSGDDFSATFVEQSIINCLIMGHQPEEALARLNVVIPEVEAAGQIPLLTVLQRYRAVALFDLGRIEESEVILRAALTVFEERRASLNDDRSRAGIFSASGELYSSLARCLLATGRTEEAFDTIERGRGSIFRDHSSDRFATVDELKIQLSRSNTALILFNDPVNEPLIAYIVDNEGLRTVDLGSSDQIIADAQAAIRLLAAGESLATCLPALERLEKSIAIPVLAAVSPDIDRFSVIPPSFLMGFPLGVLRDSQGNRWSEKRPLSYLPNATALLDLEARPAPQQGLLAFADPTDPGPSTGRLPSTPARSLAGVPLPEARTEILAITRDKTQRRVGADASATHLREAMQTSLAVLHLATHAVVDPVDGGRSAVILAGGGGIDIVTAQEISTFDFQGDLVVLSGCSTFGNHQVLGEGWFGLPRSFLTAGARSVVSTLWDVDDLGARQFVSAFYDALSQGAARDEALVEAREFCRRSGMPPRDWAAFVLTGVGDSAVPLLVQSAGFSPMAIGFTFMVVMAIGLVGWFLRQKRHNNKKNIFKGDSPGR